MAHRAVLTEPPVGAAPQLRSSCDACNAAKVKCSKGRPQCRRCEARQLPCVYGISMRSAMGRSFRSSSEAGALRLGYGQSHGYGVPGGYLQDSYASRRSRSSTPSYHSASHSAASMPSAMPPAMPTSQLPVDFFDPAAHECRSSTWPSTEDFEALTDMSVNLPANYPAHMLDGPSDNRQHSFQHSNFDSTYPSTAQANVSVANPALGLLPSPADFEQNNPAVVSCSCQQNILRESFKLSLISNGQPVALDQALSNNQIVVATCSSALNCPNHQRGPDDLTFFLTLVSLLIRVADILNAVGEACRRNPNRSSRPSSHGENNVSSLLNASDYYEVSSAGGHSAPLTPQSMNAAICKAQSAPPQGIAAGVANVTDTATPPLGAYEWSDLTEEAMQKNMLQMELSKLRNLADNIEHQYARSRGNFTAVRSVLPVDWDMHGNGRRSEELYSGRIEDQAYIVSLLLIDLKRKIQPNHEAF